MHYGGRISGRGELFDTAAANSRCQGQCLQHLGVEVTSTPEVRSARDDGRHAVIPLRVRLERHMSGHEQKNRIEADIGGIAEQNWCERPPALSCRSGCCRD